MFEASTEPVISEPFFAPSNESAIEHLFGRRESIKARIEAIASSMDGNARLALGHFLAGAERHSYGNGRAIPDANVLLNVDRAVASLDASLWQEAMDLTDVMDCMPQARRWEWIENIKKHETPPFTPENVAPTFQALLAGRAKFLAERVDGLFFNLSRKHVTNRPEGFSVRMIIQGVVSDFGSYPSHEKSGYVHDLRGVIARFMGRGEPEIADTSAAIMRAVSQPGTWITIDGGALRLRVYLGVRTGHLEVHPDMAWRLNAILASLHPAAIPSQHRQPPKRKVRGFELMQKPLPFEIIRLLRELVGQGFSRRLSSGRVPDKAQRRRVAEVLQSIGGIEQDGTWTFGYDPAEVLSEIVVSGCIPDEVSHQFFPTPAHIAAAAVQAAQIGPDDECLEPSAGLGGLADFMPKERTQCVEVSGLHCQLLRAMGYDAIEADFLAWQPHVFFDRVVMNPPYSEGRWRAHLEHAAELVHSKGRLVAILPESARTKRLLPGWNISWGQTFSFPGTSIQVAILTAERNEQS